MKYIKLFESGESQDIEDYFIELYDIGWEIEENKKKHLYSYY
jgi:hypothetical protein